jgi:hypothetical protein
MHRFGGLETIQTRETIFRAEASKEVKSPFILIDHENISRAGRAPHDHIAYS